MTDQLTNQSDPTSDQAAGPKRRRRVTSGSLALVCGVAALGVSLGLPAEAAKKIHGKTLVNNTVSGKKITNNTVTGKDVNEKTLKGFVKAGHVAAFGAAESAFIDNFTAGAFTPIVSKTFKAPRAGVLYITGSLSAEDDVTLGGDGHLSYRLRLDGTGLNSGLHELDYPGLGGGDSSGITAVVPVSAGTHTVHLDAEETGTGSFVIGREVSVLFVPSGSGFTPPAKPAPKNPQG